MTLLVALLLAASAHAQEALSGGGFELRQRSQGHGSSSAADVFGSSLSLRSAGRGRGAPAYPLTDGAGTQLQPIPGGFTLYSRLVDNQIQSTTNGDAVTVGKLASQQDFDFFFNPQPLARPLRADPAKIAQAIVLLGTTVGPQAALVPERVVELNLMLESGAFQESLAQNVTLELSYADADGDGAVDGVNPPIRARTLAIYTLDEARGAWVRVHGSLVDTASRRVRASFPHLSVYALIGTADTSVDAVYAFPVPWAPNSGDPADGTRAGGITFTNLPSEGDIRIYTVSGQSVRRLPIPTGLFPPQLRWDGRTEGGQDVVSGAYIWRVESGQNSKTGKLLIIR